MLFLLFNIETERYAIPAAKVIEVVDLVNFTKIPQAPEYVSGLMNFRGQIFPVVDLPNLFLSRPYRRMLSTRIILTDVRVKKKKIYYWPDCRKPD